MEPAPDRLKSKKFLGDDVIAFIKKRLEEGDEKANYFLRPVSKLSLIVKLTIENNITIVRYFDFLNFSQLSIVCAVVVLLLRSIFTVPLLCSKNFTTRSGSPWFLI